MPINDIGEIIILKSKPENSFTVKYLFDTRSPEAFTAFCSSLKLLLNRELSSRAHLLVLCIGSDRSTGDALGPLVGSLLQKLKVSEYVTTLGTLCKPVHAQNLIEALDYIAQFYPEALVLAVDASLGKKEHVQHLELGLGSLQPGTAVQKKLPPVGDIYVKGIVNTGGAMGFALLQCTRLYIVMQMAEFIATGLEKALHQNCCPPARLTK